LRANPGRFGSNPVVLERIPDRSVRNFTHWSRHHVDPDAIPASRIVFSHVPTAIRRVWSVSTSARIVSTSVGLDVSPSESDRAATLPPLASA